MNKLVYILALLPAIIFMGCQVSYVKIPKGDMAGNVTVNQGFSRSSVGEGNKVEASSTKTSSILTAQINPKLNSEINPSISSEVNPAISSEVNPALASEINPRLDTDINAQISDIYKTETVAEPSEEEVAEITETVE